MPPPPLQNVLQLGERLERSDARGNSLQRAQKQQARRELCDAVWAENLCDVSVALRGTDFMALGALRLPLPLSLTLTPPLALAVAPAQAPAPAPALAPAPAPAPALALALAPTLALALALAPTLTHQVVCGCRALQRRASAMAMGCALALPCYATSGTQRCRWVRDRVGAGLG